MVALSEGCEVRRIDPNASSGDGFAHEAFYSVGTLAHIEKLERPQPGLLLIHCRGAQRFDIRASQQLPHGLWTADVELHTPEASIPIPNDLLNTRDALERLLSNLLNKEPEARHNSPCSHLIDGTTVDGLPTGGWSCCLSPPSSSSA
ncbi:MAG: hypothetical protein R3E42_11330 [Burkholderiaceae bacterium]